MFDAVGLSKSKTSTGRAPRTYYFRVNTRLSLRRASRWLATSSARTNDSMKPSTVRLDGSDSEFACILFHALPHPAQAHSGVKPAAFHAAAVIRDNDVQPVGNPPDLNRDL